MVSCIPSLDALHHKIMLLFHSTNLRCCSQLACDQLPLNSWLCPSFVNTANYLRWHVQLCQSAYISRNPSADQTRFASMDIKPEQSVSGQMDDTHTLQHTSPATFDSGGSCSSLQTPRRCSALQGTCKPQQCPASQVPPWPVLTLSTRLCIVLQQLLATAHCVCAEILV